MAKVGDLTVDVNVSISDETVNRCINLLSMYLTDNPYLDLKVYDDFHEKDRINRTVSLVSRNE